MFLNIFTASIYCQKDIWGLGYLSNLTQVGLYNNINLKNITILQHLMFCNSISSNAYKKIFIVSVFDKTITFKK